MNKFIFVGKSTISALALISTSLALSVVSFGVSSTESDQPTLDEIDCNNFISKDKSLISIKNCDKVDLDLVTPNGSRVKIKSKGKSNSVVIKIGK